MAFRSPGRAAAWPVEHSDTGGERVEGTYISSLWRPLWRGAQHRVTQREAAHSVPGPNVLTPPPEAGENCSAREPATGPQGPSSCVSITHEIPARKGCSSALRPAVLVRGSQQITSSLHHCPSNGGPQNVCPLSRSHQGTFLFNASTLSEPNSPRLGPGNRTLEDPRTDPQRAAWPWTYQDEVHCSQWNLLSNPGWLRTIQDWPSKDIGSVIGTADLSVIDTA